MKKRLIVFVTVFFLLAGCGANGASGDSKQLKEIRIGIQQSLSPLLIAKEKGWFEDAFEKEGIKVKWVEFQSGPPQFEGLAADKLDFSQVGNSPVISGQAAGIDFKEIGLSQDGLKANGILVNQNSGIQDVKDLKGKKIAVAKGSSGFDFLYKALDQVGLSANDVTIIQLQPDEAASAFENGSVDAWSIWEPYLSLETIKHGAKILVNGESTDLYSPGFTLVRTKFAEEHPDEVVRFLKVFNKAVVWQKEHLDEAADLYADIKDLDKKVVENVLKNTEPLNEVISDDIVKAQQETADFQYQTKAIDKKIDVKEVVDNTFIKKALKENSSGGDQ
ncbi:MULTISPECIES: aliphatic sulfonate ABC transporter substrate-binding protein [unclassified Bacillus (in: firmicutes)]|uniref:aliphatic sulfonate ABC transporter substrate-binding protein n=1 Tax=unclassified Bacillus (in: firmicutes) TaxID=185979 RepID=UPI00227E61E1|nr:aliphatic sulfonate ABC transporter substrate-binding protein [Bacillus sp. S20C3]MCY8289153.1 aliphatic sulfonate ABC transporter substrate-binding protein [Bacillus sp. N13C7]MCY8636333.1 aliphatic sulfonate ABC transporter substrate-binding protein [Bacillus sp. S17B2]MCY8720285.1 aliphatic sulfonate ABC transporter substrate-binding protein [Bacillus sp. S10C12M]MCY9144074.1 aliphatic sulfonate ABC transporter substrate-binding protein [Bacillus sp. T9C1]